MVVALRHLSATYSQAFDQRLVDEDQELGREDGLLLAHFGDQVLQARLAAFNVDHTRE